MRNRLRNRPDRWTCVVLTLVVLILTVGAAIAIAAGSSPSFSFSSDEPGITFTCQLDGGAASACASPKTYTNLAPGAHSETIIGSFTVPNPPPPSTVLLGDQNVETTGDTSTAPASEAFGFTAGQSGTATSASVYLTSTDGATVGLYADSSSKPGALLDKGNIASNAAGWATVPLNGATSITSGTRYWIAVGGNSGGKVTYRDHGSSGTNLDFSGSGFADPYSSSGQWNSNPISAYVSGTASTSSSSTSSTSTTASSTTTDTTTTTTTMPSASGTYSLPADRTFDWNPGLNAVGGIPSGGWSVYKTISPSGGDDTATIQAALDSCPKDGVVQLAAGVFHISGGGNGLVINSSYCVLRGVGPGPGNWSVGTAASGTGGTYLESAVATNPVVTLGSGGTASPINLTADVARGSKSVTVASTSGLSAGQLVVVDETTDTNVSRWNDGNSAQTSGWFEESNRPLGDTLEIASISGNTVTFTTDLPIGYQVAHSAHLEPLTNQVNDSGVEDLYTYGGYFGAGIPVWNCSHCWVKHVESTWSSGCAVELVQSFGVEVRDSYFHDSPSGMNAGGSSYGICVDQYTSNSLIENNISTRFNKVDVMRSAGGGNVFGYNYMDDGADQNGAWFEYNANSSHMTTPHYELFEGNQAANFDQDDRWGNSVDITVFRNDLTGHLRDFSTSAPLRAAGVTQWHWYQSFVGNVLGTPGHPGENNYETVGAQTSSNWTGNIWAVCYQKDESTPDGGKCQSTILRDGNFDYLTGKVHWHGIGGTGVNNGLTPPADSTLPDSLYLSSKPAFFGANAWPWVDGSSASTPLPGSLPARSRYDAGTPNGVN